MNPKIEFPANTKIMIVEDDPFIKSLIGKKLEDNKVAFTSLDGGTDAVEKIRKEKPTLILLDIMLPGGVDGLEILRQLKQDPELKEIPVIMLSNLGDKKSISIAHTFGAELYLVKATLSIDEIVSEAAKQLAGK